MRVGKSVSKALLEMEAGDAESAMLHACNAIDGTGRKLFPGEGSTARFTKVLRENYLVFGAMLLPGMDFAKERFLVDVRRPSTPDGRADIADVIYGIHRCSHGHGDELPNGFELMPDVQMGSELTTFRWRPDEKTVRLSDRVIYALIAVAVLSPANVGERASDGDYLTLGAAPPYIINEWWGRAAEFEVIAAAMPPSPVLYRYRKVGPHGLRI